MSILPTSIALTDPTGRRAAAAAWLLQLAALARASFARHRWFAAIIGVYFIGAAAVEWRFTGSVGASFQLYTMTCIGMIAIMTIAILMIHAVYVMIAIRPVRLFHELGSRYRTSLFRPDRIANALPVLVLLPIFFNSFTVLKTSVPRIAPFAWDAAFETADRWLHGGTAPWLLLQPWFERHMQAPHFVDLAYVLWFFVLWLVVVWQIFRLDAPALRAQFLGTLVLCWILLGTLGSFLLSSAGPCYFGRITGLADPYTPLMAYLRQANRIAEVWSLQTQDMLWSYYAGREIGFGGGISAMPSMHVAMAFLLTLMASRLHWGLGLGAFLYYLAIQIGSVQLGWHYAVDGYAATAATAILWWAVGRAVDRHAPRPAPRARIGAAAFGPVSCPSG